MAKKKWSKASCAANRQGHLQPEGITKPKMVRSRLCNKQTRPLTSWGQHKATKWSEAGCAANRKCHLHPEGIPRPQMVRNKLFGKQTRPLTYWGHHHQGEKWSKGGCAANRWNDLPTDGITRPQMVGNSFPVKTLGHLQSEPQWSSSSKNLQNDQITYFLRAPQGSIISIWYCWYSEYLQTTIRHLTFSSTIMSWAQLTS